MKQFDAHCFLSVLKASLFLWVPFNLELCEQLKLKPKGILIHRLNILWEIGRFDWMIWFDWIIWLDDLIGWFDLPPVFRGVLYCQFKILFPVKCNTLSEYIFLRYHNYILRYTLIFENLLNILDLQDAEERAPILLFSQHYENRQI